MLNPQVSIIVPVFNVKDYLDQCLISLLNQTLLNIEIILVDDGSTDGSGEICDLYATSDSRVRVLHKQNGGLSDARNVGLEMATGEYILFVDSDDWIDVNTCEYAFNQAIEYKAELVFWSRVKENDTTSIKENPIFENDQKFQNEGIVWLHRRICGLYELELMNPTKTDTINSAWGKLYKSSVIKKNNIRFHDTSQVGSEDVLFNFYVLKHINIALYIKKYFSHYRTNNPNSLTKNHKSTLFLRYLNLFAFMNEFIKNQNLDCSFLNALNNRIALSIINVSLSITSPLNALPLNEKLNDIKFVLTHPVYRAAIKKLDFSYLPTHWKVFFALSKVQSVVGVYYMAKIMRRFR